MLEILQCKHCPELAVSINDTRITSHKCAGQWTVIARLPYDAEVALRAIQDACIRAQCNEAKIEALEWALRASSPHDEGTGRMCRQHEREVAVEIARLKEDQCQ